MAKIGFIGMGNMGTAIMRGLLKTYKPEELLFTSAHEAKMQKITEETGVAHVSTATDCAEQVKIPGAGSKAAGTSDSFLRN